MEKRWKTEEKNYLGWKDFYPCEYLSRVSDFDVQENHCIIRSCFADKQSCELALTVTV